MNSLKIQNPVLVGESLGGEELSSVASRYPGRVAGLVYLDAAYQYAFDNGKGTTIQELQSAIKPQVSPPEESDRASFKALQAWYTRVAGFTLPEAELRQGFNALPNGRWELLARRRPTRIDSSPACGSTRTFRFPLSRFLPSLTISDLG
jgi:non-heme chloroperoxidase